MAPDSFIQKSFMAEGTKGTTPLDGCDPDTLPASEVVAWSSVSLVIVDRDSHLVIDTGFSNFPTDSLKDPWSPTTSSHRPRISDHIQRTIGSWTRVSSQSFDMYELLLTSYS